MCGAHWHLVPQNIQRAVYRAYRPGQCDDKNPSSSWHTAADAAIGYVAALDGQAMRVKEVTALSGFGFETSTDAYGNLTVKLAALKALA